MIFTWRLSLVLLITGFCWGFNPPALHSNIAPRDIRTPLDYTTTNGRPTTTSPVVRRTSQRKGGSKGKRQTDVDVRSDEVKMDTTPLCDADGGATMCIEFILERLVSYLNIRLKCCG